MNSRGSLQSLGPLVLDDKLGRGQSEARGARPGCLGPLVLVPYLGDLKKTHSNPCACAGDTPWVCSLSNHNPTQANSVQADWPAREHNQCVTQSLYMSAC